MNKPSPDNIRQFEAELRNLQAAGIPLQFETGKNFEAEIANDARLAASYRSALEVWLACDRSPVALESMTDMAIRNQRSHRAMSLAMVQPLVLLFLAFGALIYISSGIIPKIESIYDQIQKQPSFGLSFMILIRTSMWFWICLTPILLMAWAFYRRKNLSTVNALESQRSDRSNVYVPSAICSAQLAEVTCYGRSFDDARKLIEPIRQIDPTASRPLLVWALSSENPGATDSIVSASALKVNQLRLASQTYRYLDRMRVQQLRSWLPAIAIGLFGGLIVLAIGLSVVIPSSELLRDLSAPSER